ncbi:MULTISPECIES: macro domain-containing protein [Curtobacterium]|jgi:O-acetyl-ADP-ribose deacetylase (regulator of RNase III)|uniref:Macro domain-containing protein n=2 Tax=Curtobacterium TaxID=2034 RepID=A0A5P8YW03_9MICO|nr:macro domain-containing protein [Curtobacterium flaccumfaciens]MBO9041482.1 macro domain-containing protein [Curtobacterium flaccumfaciens pv. flaccumfaciens]MBO9044968.1 macro domain-containing protein [Curtobacterium flaccumfaciens pv. flaccumfaciens]MBO9048889.1 macro domain-containing protein [Curtobacterium flaccumfaciens pv. flaccumfaciens]MBO9057740.1 macro domain-containing protein [Curtobacterium flaccumfaciens pv. flaccumfaciens]MBT1543179.1 macro domain-containing protein [Curtob
MTERVNVGTAVLHDYSGDVFDAGTDVFVNPWNRNFVPRWLMQPGGISGALLTRTGPEPWKELAQRRLLVLGEAVLTGSGQWDGAAAIVHVAGINAAWRASECSVRTAARNAVDATAAAGFSSMLLPLIGSGHGGLDPVTVRAAIIDELSEAGHAGARAVDVYVPVVVN